MLKIDFGSDDIFIERYKELKSATKMAEFYNCSKSSVLLHSKEIGYNPNDNKEYKLSEEDKIAIIAAYQKEITSTELAQQYNVSRGMITKLWHDAGLSGKKKTVTKIHFPYGYRVNALQVLAKTTKRDSSGSILWECICDCGNIAYVSSSRLKSGAAKSCGCLSKRALELGRQCRDLTSMKFGALTVLERDQNYITSTGSSLVKWKCQCSCGITTSVLASNLLSGNTQSCGQCGNNSHGNQKIATLLTEHNIPFVREYRFEDCCDKKPLPFDFFVDNSYLIEFDGRQHFEEDNFFFNPNTTKQHDKIKNEWCKTHQIPLIRIPYYHYQELSINDLKLDTTWFLVE